MKRRTFLQLSGMTAAGAVLAGCQGGKEKLMAALLPPDEGVTPGQAQYYASTCRFCPAGCGTLVRVSEGRAKKIEGNPKHPVNRGKLCARGQAVLQELYHPDRVRQPLKRIGPCGSGKFAQISWEEAVGQLGAQLKAMQQEKTTDALALLTPPLKGSMAELTTRFMTTFGSPHHLSYDLLGSDWLQNATRQSLGQPHLPYYDLAETRYLLSFGADFVEHHLSPVHYGHAFGQMRQGRNTIRGHFTYIGGRMSLTAASADRWLPARPGTEGLLALGLARQILIEALHDEQALSESGLKHQELLDRLASCDLPLVARQTGLSEQIIAEVAREFATTRPAMAMAGETVAFHSNGLESVRAIQLLNLLTGSLNRPGGLYPEASPPPTGGNPFSEMLGLIAAMQQGRIRLALIHGNPFYTLPPATGFQEALAKVPFVVSFSSLIDDTALQADLILPDHTALESWGEVIPSAGSRQPVIGLMQPVVAPLFDTRPFPDLLLTLAHDLGGETASALPYESYLAMLKESIRKQVQVPAEADFETVWIGLLQQGGVFDAAQAPDHEYRWMADSTLPLPTPPRFVGEESNYPLHLQVYPTTAFHDGRGAPLPWLQQLPDPMSTVVWGSWVEINPQTAAEWGIGFGDLVEVTSPRGSLQLPAVLYPGIRPDLVAIPMGQGHRGMGRYAEGRGQNPLALLTPLSEGGQMQPAWSATRVRIARAPGPGEMVTAGHPEGSLRSELIEI